LLLLAAGCASAPTHVPDSMPAADPDEALQSNDILAREAVSNRTEVQHILISWKDLAANFQGHQTERAAARTHDEANALAQDLLKRVRAGEAMEPLMHDLSDDEGSSQNGKGYEVTPSAGLVFSFKRLGLRLQVGEVGLVKSQFGWHVMKRTK
jgi:peptidyl-prolyl cis-trans isomerase D